MFDRSSSPDSAFAYVGKINGVTFKLLRHHYLDKVKDGLEHDTVDPVLLSACLKMIDQVPVSTEDREKIRLHLSAHAGFKLDLTDPTNALKIINQQNAGDAELGHKTINDTEYKFEPEPNIVSNSKADPAGNDIAKVQDAKEVPSVKAGVVLEDGEKPVSNPNQDDNASDKPVSGGNSGEGKQVVTDDNSQEVSNPNKDKMGVASLSNVNEEDKKKDNSEVDSLSQSAEVAKKKKKKNKKRPALRHKWSGYSINKIILNKSDNKINIIKNDAEYDTANNELLGYGYGRDDLDKFDSILVASLVPSPHNNQNQAGTVLMTDSDGMVNNPNKDKFGKASLIVDSDDFTEFGRKFVLKLFGDVISGKTVAKIHSVDTEGTIEFVTLKVGNDENYPLHIMLDVHKNSEGKIMRIKLLNESLPGEILADIAKFLNNMSKDAFKPEDVKASIPEQIDQATAPAKLEKCKSSVLAQQIKNFTKKNGHPPSEKQKKKMESSAFAICTANLKKSGQM